MIQLILLLSLPLLVDAGCAVDLKHSTLEPGDQGATQEPGDHGTTMKRAVDMRYRTEECKPDFWRFDRVNGHAVCLKAIMSDTAVSKDQAAALCTAEGYKLMGLNSMDEAWTMSQEMQAVIKANVSVFIDGTRAYTECNMDGTYAERNKMVYSDGLTDSNEVLAQASIGFDCAGKDTFKKDYKCMYYTNAPTSVVWPAPCTGVVDNVKGAMWIRIENRRMAV
uniref:C-type lectin domain-containing protein n=1 Tax=Caenorhabditis tropicalis TaxID=1561998 RepID=A0A1I7TBN4_9PELO